MTTAGIAPTGLSPEGLGCGDPRDDLFVALPEAAFSEHAEVMS